MTWIGTFLGDEDHLRKQVQEWTEKANDALDARDAAREEAKVEAARAAGFRRELTELEQRLQTATTALREAGEVIERQKAEASQDALELLAAREQAQEALDRAVAAEATLAGAFVRGPKGRIVPFARRAA